MIHNHPEEHNAVRLNTVTTGKCTITLTPPFLRLLASKARGRKDF